MPGRLRRSRALARATQREVLRRPGVLLATAAAAALLTLLHELSAATFGARPGLAMELGLSTAGLFLSVVAGVTGVQCTARGAGLGPTDSLEATPLSRGEYAVARFAGVAAAATPLLLLLGVGTVVGLLLSGVPALPPAATQVAAVVGVIVQACVFAALGMALGAFAPSQLAVVLTIGALVASRTFVPQLAAADGGAGALALALPDPARLDLAREVGAGHTASLASAALAWCGALALSAALLVATVGGLGRERTLNRA